MGRNRRARGTNRRALDDYVRQLRKLGDLDAFVDVVVRSCRDSADRLDAADADRDESRFTAARCAAEHRTNLQWLAAMTATSSAPTSSLFDDLTAALRDTAPT